MSDAVLVAAKAFNLVLRDPAQATVSHTERPQSELARLRASCAALTESERSLKTQLAKEQERVKSLQGAFSRSSSAALEALEQTARRELVALSLRLAEVIVRRQLPDRDMIGAVIQRTLSPLGDTRGVRVRLNPVDAKALTGAGADGVGAELAGRLEIVADPGLKPGDATLDTPIGYFDARLAERFRLLEDRLDEHSRARRCGAGDKPAQAAAAA